MEKLYISNKNETPRLFQNDFMEFFSRVHWSVPLYLYIPLILLFFYLSISSDSIKLVNIAGFYIFGIFVWSFIEYFLHRFLFHYKPGSDNGKRIIFIFHGIHHAYPMDARRLVMPPSVSLPLALLFYYLFYLILGTVYLYPFFSGFLTGYLVYDMTHFAIHHIAIKNKYWLKIKAYHMRHHYQYPNNGFGVSQPLWDYVFGTRFKN